MKGDYGERPSGGRRGGDKGCRVIGEDGDLLSRKGRGGDSVG